MYNENGILGNQLVVMSREDFDNLVNEAAQNMVAAQTKKNDYSKPYQQYFPCKFQFLFYQ